MRDFSELFKESKRACSSINHNGEGVAEQDGSEILKMSSMKPQDG